jgi:ribosome-associated protein
MQLETLRQLVVDTLDDMKARDIEVMDVRGKTAITDYMIVASGTSDRHVKAIAETVAYKSKEAGETPLGWRGHRGRVGPGGPQRGRGPCHAPQGA